MQNLLQPARISYTIGIIAFALLSINAQDFVIGRPPAWPSGINPNPLLAYFSAAVLVVAGIGIALEKRAVTSALAIAAMITFFSLFRHLPQFMNDWLNAYKTMALLGGTLIVAASFRKPHIISSKPMVSDQLKKYFILIGTIFLSAFFISAGYAHFKFADFVINFIPSYIPFRSFWTYFTGICLIAGGLGLLLPFTRKYAALLSGMMVLGWFLLLHIPRLIDNINDASERLGLVESFSIAAIFFVLYSYYKAPAKSLI